MPMNGWLVKLVAEPRSGLEVLKRFASVYAPSPKNAAWPSEM